MMDRRVFEILLIEDDADDAELTIFALKRSNLGNPITHIDDGEKALEFLFSAPQYPSLILLDLKMPRVDGIQILRKLKSDPDRKQIPVVALISSKEGKGYVESFGIKADGYIIKPLDNRQFSQTVSAMGISSMIVNGNPENPGN